MKRILFGVALMGWSLFMTYHYKVQVPALVFLAGFEIGVGLAETDYDRKTKTSKSEKESEDAVQEL